MQVRRYAAEVTRLGASRTPCSTDAQSLQGIRSKLLNNVTSVFISPLAPELPFKGKAHRMEA